MNVSLKLKDKTILPTFKIERIKRIDTDDKTYTIIAYYTADKNHIMYSAHRRSRQPPRLALSCLQESRKDLS